MLALILVFLLSGVVSAYDLSEAMDTSLSFTTGGSADWFGQFLISYYDGDAAQSGDISDSQESWMQTTVSGLTTVSFYWKVSSERGYDYLGFYIDGSLQDSISGSEDWQQMMYTLSTDSHTLKWRYVKDESADSGNDCGWVDQIEWGTDPPQPPPSYVELSEALDTTLSFTTGGGADWFAQNSTFYYGGDAAQSGSISGNQESWIQTTVSGPTTVSFYWTVFSEFHYDFLEFYIDDSLQDSIHGSFDFGPLDWQQMTYTLGSGPHTLKWQYTKDEVDDAGDDCGWVDYVTVGTDPGSPPSSCDLSEALDSSLSFTTGGSADWFCQSNTFFYDGDAAQSGDIPDAQESWMQTTVTGPTTVSFYWKVSSESGYDYQEFYIDGSLQDSISGPVDWQQIMYALGSGTQTLKWRYVKDSSFGSGSDCGWVDHVELGTDPEPPPSPGDLSEAMDTTLSFTTGGTVDWFSQTTTFYYDGDAAQSGSIADNQESWLQTTVSGPTTVNFYWKVSSESGYDLLEFYIDGSLQDSISGSVDWQQMIYTLGSGSHTLKWRYVKDGSLGSGSDCGWVDHVELGTDPDPPPSPGDLSEAMDTTLSFTRGGIADWFSQTATSYYGGDAAESGDITDNQESWMQTTASGPTTASFYWKVSSESGYDLLQFYLDGSLQDSISGSVDWQQMIYTLGSGSHTLKWRYVKDGSVSSGSDCGWVDRLELGTDPDPPPSPGDLSEAMDTSLSFTTGGIADWFAQTTTFYYDGDAAQSGDILDTQDSWMRSVVGGAGTLSFYWKVSSEYFCDFLDFYVNSLLQDRISGSVDWQQMTYPLDSGSHVLEWRYVKDYSMISGSDCGWVDHVEWVTGSEPPPPPPPSCDLSEAMDTTLSFTKGGSADWFCQGTSYYGGDAAQSGFISHNQLSWMETTVSGPTTVSFYWKVSSEVGFDNLQFYIDHEVQDSISGSGDWQQMTYALPSGSHILFWRYVKDGSVSSGSDCGWVDKIELGAEPEPPSPSCDLSEAMDTTLSFTTEGAADWFCQGISYYGGDAARSGDISDNQESLMRTTVDGPTTVNFYWKISSEVGFDFLEFYINNQLIRQISGSVDWEPMGFTLPASLNTLEWRYFKDGSASSDSDCGWVDKIELGTDPEPPPSSGDLSEALDTSLSFTTGGSADWFEQSLIAYYDGDAAQSGGISHDEESWMQTTVNGAGKLSFYWKVSSEEEADFLQFYIGLELQSWISGLVDWQQMTYTLGSGSHTLEWIYIKDISDNYESDCGWVDKVEWVTGQAPPSSCDLYEGLDTSLSFTTGGNADWFCQETVFYNDGDAAQSGDISDSQESWMQTVVSGPSTVSYYWKVSSESDYDFLEFYIDGVLQSRISDAVDWHRMSYALSSGFHTLEWRYVKDGSVSLFTDCGWVDFVEVN